MINGTFDGGFAVDFCCSENFIKNTQKACVFNFHTQAENDTRTTKDGFERSLVTLGRSCSTRLAERWLEKAHRYNEAMKSAPGFLRLWYIARLFVIIQMQLNGLVLRVGVQKVVRATGDFALAKLLFG